MQLAFDGQVEPLLRARFHPEIHPRAVAQNSHQPDGLIRKRVIGKRAHFLFFKVGQAVRRIEQQPARLRIQRNGNRIDRKIATPQILHDPRETDLRFGAGLLIDIIARARNRAIHVARENHFVVPQLLAFPKRARSALLEFAHHPHRIPFHREIEVANRLARNQIAHRTAGQVNIHVLRARQFLHALQHGTLFRREPAFQQIHVIGHERYAFPRIPRDNF